MLRAMLWVVFALVAFAVVFGFAGGGHGSFAPEAVFYSWAFLAFELSHRLIRVSPQVETATFLSMAALYPLALGICAGFVVERWGLKFYGAVIALHAVGVVLAATQLEHGHLATPALVQFSYLVSSAILVVLFAFDHAVLDHKLKQRDEASSVAE